MRWTKYGYLVLAVTFSDKVNPDINFAVETVAQSDVPVVKTLS